MQGLYLCAGAHYLEGGPIALQPANAGVLIAFVFVAFTGQIEFGLATGHQQVDICQDLRIEQGPVQGTVGVVYAVTIAEHIQVVALAREEIRAIARVSVMEQISAVLKPRPSLLNS